MAHECPECGHTCYCNGDIDDCLLPDSQAEARCTCCECDMCGKSRDDCVCECSDCGNPIDMCFCFEECDQ